jgi:hypothetical protein
MMKKLAIPVCFALLAAGALVHGASIRRWDAFTPGADRAAKIHAHVLQLGDYQMEQVPNDMPLKEKSIATSRRYFSPSRNQLVVTSVISGAPGSVATHTPDVCYPSSGYRTVREPKRETIDLPGGGKASYYFAEFEKKTATQTERQRVRWAWTVDGNWEAPERARFAYLRAPELYKLYIVTPVPAADLDAKAGDPPAVRQFVAHAFAQYAGLVAGR